MTTCANDSIPLNRRGGFCPAQAPQGLPEAGMRAQGWVPDREASEQQSRISAALREAGENVNPSTLR